MALRICAEYSNRWESLIFQSGFKLSRRAPINPEKQHLRRKQIHSDCETLRLLIQLNKGLIGDSAFSLVLGSLAYDRRL